MKRSEKLYSALAAADRLLADANIPYILLCGTLLGAVRDGSLLDWDADIDLGVWDKDRAKLPNLNFRKLGNDELGWEFKLKLNDIVVDLFFLHNDKNTTWFNCGIAYKYNYPLITETTTIKIGNRYWPVPSNYKECLIANYGENWNTPQKEWSWQNAPCCESQM